MKERDELNNKMIESGFYDEQATRLQLRIEELEHKIEAGWRSTVEL